MPSYQLAFDDRGRPLLEEESNGQHPDETLFLHSIRQSPGDGWTRLVEQMTRHDEAPACPGEWEVLPGAADPAACFPCDSRRPAPFGFERGRA